MFIYINGEKVKMNYCFLVFILRGLFESYGDYVGKMFYRS